MKIILKNCSSIDKMVDRLLVFDLVGKFACWKKFYSNSSSFTYEIPSRTNIIGIIASILELPRDSYYEKLSSENCKISLKLMSKLKKKFHCLNYFKKPNQRDYTQIRLEVLTPEDFYNESIRYRVYIYLKNKELFDKLIKKVKARNFGFGVYLGQRQFKGDIEFVQVVKNIKLLNNVEEINSICNLKNTLSNQRIQTSNIMTEKMPIDFNFVGTQEELNINILNRELLRMGEIVYSRNPNLDKISINCKKALEISYNGNIERICLYEEEF